MFCYMHVVECTELVRLLCFFLVCMSGCNVHILYAKIYVRDRNVTKEAAAVWRKGGILWKNSER